MKIIIYQVLVRLFGNSCTRNLPYGSIKENGVGKFSDIDDLALQSIKELGVTHLWLTGILQHAVVADYSAYDIPLVHPHLVKGRAGSPYAVTDYFNVNPDLANDPANRLVEFVELVERIHRNGLKVIIDIVPNHVSRQYHSTSLPRGVRNFGENDDISVVYARNNNFYYNQGEELVLPPFSIDYNIEETALQNLLKTTYREFPAKWTGNSDSSHPQITDWYETIKLNYGVSPEGRKDFDTLPPEFANFDYPIHYSFWRSRSVPDTWIKFKDIVAFWLALGVDGFRYDMAEMVPVEFWSFLNSFIKTQKPDAFLLAEVYDPHLYRDYLHFGKMDSLYNKVGLYDVLKEVLLARLLDINTAPINVLANYEALCADCKEHLADFNQYFADNNPHFTGYDELCANCKALLADCKALRAGCDPLRAGCSLPFSGSTDKIDDIQEQIADISLQMLHFLENHDEQRVASASFAKDGVNAKPAMVVATLLNDAALMLYFGQEVGERACEEAGFGSSSRTSIFDYIGVPAFQRWSNDKRYDGGQLSAKERQLRDFYRRLLHIKVSGGFKNIHKYNRRHTPYYNDRVYAFVREEEMRKWVVVANFSPTETYGFDLQIPYEIISNWQLADGDYLLTDMLYQKIQVTLQKYDNHGKMRVDIAPLESFVFLIAE